MPDDQNTAQLTDDVVEVEEVESTSDEDVEQAAPSPVMQGMPSGAERQNGAEQQKSIDSQTNKELPPFIQNTITHAQEGRQQAQQVKKQDLPEAVKIEEQVLGELSALAGLAPSEHAEQTSMQEEVKVEEQPAIPIQPTSTAESTMAIHGQTTTTEEPEVQAPEPIVRMSDNFRPEARDVTRSPEPNRAPEKPVAPESDSGRDATVSLLNAVIEKLETNTQNIDKLAVENSEEALFRMIQKDAMKVIRDRVREGQWDSIRSMESLAMKMGIFSIIGLFRELKNKTTNETMRQKIQQAIDYMLNENDRLDLEDAQAQKASDAVQDDTYSDPTTGTSTGTVSVANATQSSGIVSTNQFAQATPTVPTSTSPSVVQPAEPVAPLPPGIG